MKINTITLFGDSIICGAVCSENMRLRLRENPGFGFLNGHGYKVYDHSRIGETINKGIDIISRMGN